MIEAWVLGDDRVVGGWMMDYTFRFGQAKMNENEGASKKSIGTDVQHAPSYQFPIILHEKVEAPNAKNSKKLTHTFIPPSFPLFLLSHNIPLPFRSHFRYFFSQRNTNINKRI